MIYAACVEYDGAAFHGWQAQKHNVCTVQETVEAALSRVADQPVAIVTAGRTDTGVHATHQVIHFTTEVERDEFAWCRGTNRFMSDDVRIRWVVPVAEDFHARFSALSRSYRFVIYNHSIPSAVFRQYVTHEYRELTFERMRVAAQILQGEHDFSSFRAAGCQAHSPVRCIESIVLQKQDHWIWFDVTANAFLQHMVRNIAGCLIEVGCGKRETEWIEHLLEVRDRTKGGITAAPYGLYLTGVGYPDHFRLPSASRDIAFWG